MSQARGGVSGSGGGGGATPRGRGGCASGGGGGRHCGGQRPQQTAIEQHYLAELCKFIEEKGEWSL